MADIKIYLDEDVHPFIADALRLRGWQALTTVEAQRRSSTDRGNLRSPRPTAARKTNLKSWDSGYPVQKERLGTHLYPL